MKQELKPITIEVINNITKEDIEEMLGYKINNFKIEPVFKENICIGLSILVTPIKVIEHIDITFKIDKDGIQTL